MKKLTYLLLIICCALFSCTQDDGGSNGTDQLILFDTVGQDALLGNGEENITESNIVIRTQAQWDELVNKMDSVNPVSENFSFTPIDFEQDMIIAIFDQIRPTAGYDIFLTIIQNQQEISVYVTDLAAEGTNATIQTQPFYLAKIPASDTPVVFP